MLFKTVIELLLLGLFTSRFTYMLVEEDGIFGLVERFRRIFGLYHEKDEYDPDNVVVRVTNKSPLFRSFAEALLCVKCTSVWVAGITSAVFLPADLKSWVLQTFVLSFLSIAFNRFLDA